MNELTQKVRKAVRIEDVVSDFIKIKKIGLNHIGLCPFHKETVPSFTVSSAKGIYKCFGCNKGGDAISFVMKYKDINHLEAVTYLAKKYGIPLVFYTKKEAYDLLSSMWENGLLPSNFTEDHENHSTAISHLMKFGYLIHEELY
jgi:DNA primase